MDFVPVYDDEQQGGAVAGRALVSLSPARRGVLGLHSEPVRRMELQRTIRTVGRVTADERRLHHVHTKLEAYIEHLYVDYTGKFVPQGRAARLPLQPRAGGHAAGVPPGLARAGRSSAPAPSLRWRGAAWTCSRPRASACCCWTSVPPTSPAWRARARCAARWTSTRR